jgi:phage FluMu protein Com
MWIILFLVFLFLICAYVFFYCLFKVGARADLENSHINEEEAVLIKCVHCNKKFLFDESQAIAKSKRYIWLDCPNCNTMMMAHNHNLK